MLTQADHARIEASVADIEAKSEGEVLCVLAHQVSHYREVPLAAGAIFALVLPPIALAVGLRPGAFLVRAEEAWSAAHGFSESDIGLALGVYAVAQAVLFLLGAGIALLPPVRRLITPRSLKRHRVHRAALAQFAGAGFHEKDGPPGVVIFASEDERMVEILASAGLHQLAGEAVWDKAVSDLVAGIGRGAPADGFVAAIALCGEALIQHFPAKGAHANQHSDRLIEL